MDGASDAGPATIGATGDLASEAIALSIVIPTFNERDNVAALVDRIAGVLPDLSWEVIFVDDASPDGTSAAVRALAQTDRRVRLISRHNRRGLSSAVVEGAYAAAADVIAVMDGDLQHDEAVLPELFRRVRAGEADIASASRFLDHRQAEGLSGAGRRAMSSAGVRLANRLFGLTLTDPLTGFFAMRRDVFETAAPGLSEMGFKILLDLIVSSKPRPKLVEVGFTFRERGAGESKLDQRVIYEFALFFLDKTVCRVVPLPPRFLSFAFIGGIGVFVHLAVLAVLFEVGGLPFIAAQTGATLTALAFNFTLNNMVTYFDQRLRGAAFVRGLVLFALLCSVGIAGNVGAAAVLHDRFGGVNYPVEALSYLIPAVVGILIGVVWNFVVTNLFVWRRP